MDANEVLRKVPPELQKLVRVVSRAFYQPQQIVILDILTRYPCVTEYDLVDVLKMHGAQKQLRQSLTSLKNDKLIKCLQKMESGGEVEEGQKQHLKMVHYYYINYKQFVNVVKYKLDQMRKKIESEEKQAQNRMSYVCPRCSSSYSDLDVDRLFDPTDGSLRCSHCGGQLEEDRPQRDDVDTRTLISRLNDQMSVITTLLRQTENINLAPEILEPEAQSIQQHLEAKGIKRASATGTKDQHMWGSRASFDLYGDSTTVSVNIGGEEQSKEKVKAKEQPEWMAYSTVHPSGNIVQELPGASPLDPMGSGTTNTYNPSVPDHHVLSELLTHEGKNPLMMGGAGPSGLQGASYPGDDIVPEYSSSSDDEPVVGGASSTWPTVNVEEEEDSDDDDEQLTMQVGGKTVAWNEVTDEMVAKMTAEEKETYKRICQQALNREDYMTL